MAQSKLKLAATVTAQPIQPKKTLAAYKTLADTAVKNLEAAYGELGKILIDAEIDLGKQEYGVFVLHLKHKGISPAQIECARGVAQKKIDPSFAFYAEKKLRLPMLPISAQHKLGKLSHPIKKPDGGVEHKKGSSGTTVRKFGIDGSSCALITWQFTRPGQISFHGSRGSSV
jgi:hypothetical protein